jgi:hypothetical protein
MALSNSGANYIFIFFLLIYHVDTNLLQKQTGLSILLAHHIRHCLSAIVGVEWTYNGAWITWNGFIAGMGRKSAITSK